MDLEKSGATPPPFLDEFRHCWQAMPDKAIFMILFGAWLALFHYLGNATLGYIQSQSLFIWLAGCYKSPDDAHGPLIPLAVLALCWWKRKALLATPKQPWWPALLGVAFALALHLLGFKIQQTRFSVVAFFLGIYALTGVLWGPFWLKESFFPFILLVFCMPLSAVADQLTLPLRFLATAITAWISQIVLGVNVIRHGTLLFNANGQYQYEIAAACSGLRSLIAILALATVYGFMNYRHWGRRLITIASAFPLAVMGNVLRLLAIIVAAEMFGQKAGNYIHDSTLFSLLPYVPVFAGLPLLGFWLRESPAPPTSAKSPDPSAHE
jgi:exosortase